MKRRAFLASVGAAAATSTIPTAAAEEDGSDGEVVAESRDRYVVYKETENYHTGAEQASWIIKNRHTDDEVFSLDFPINRIKHSYASDHHVFVALSMADESINAHTVEWLLQDDMGRVRTVQKNGDTRIYDVYASGMTQVRG